MASEDKESRTEEPTPRRLEKAHEEGQVSRSVELTAAVVLLAGLSWSMSGAAGLLQALAAGMAGGLGRATAQDLTPDALLALLHSVAFEAATAIGPLFLVVALAALVVNIAQIGLGLYPKRLAPDLSRISLAKGVERMFSPRALMELLKNLVKVVLIGWLTWQFILSGVPGFANLGLAGPRVILETAGDAFASLFLSVVSVLGMIAGADWFWQRRQHQQTLRMTKQEIRDEQRQSEGDPKIRQRFRKAQRQMSSNRMLSDVSTAHVVITNPTHVAVALRYDPESMGAPRVVAKGAEEAAARIREEARRHGIPMLERRALARALFRSVPVGGEVPATLYRAIAEILAWVYGLKAQRAG